MSNRIYKNQKTGEDLLLVKNNNNLPNCGNGMCRYWQDHLCTHPEYNDLGLNRQCIKRVFGEETYFHYKKAF